MELLPLPEHDCKEVWMHCGESLCSECYSRHMYTQHQVFADYMTFDGIGILPISEWLELFGQVNSKDLHQLIARDVLSEKQLLRLEAVLRLKATARQAP